VLLFTVFFLSLSLLRVGTLFYSLASLAVISYALTWLIGFYLLTAGGTFVALKLVSANMRIEDGRGGAARNANIQYEDRYRR
jgi:asparagine N-glycosylation enzyme membrane subunit Stt3